MTASKVLLLRILQNLAAEELKEFQWFLQQQEILQDFPAIPKSRLENANRMDTVDQMILTYCINTIKVAKIVLGEIRRNDLVENLSQNPLEPADILLQCQQKLKSKLQKKYQYVFAEITKKQNTKLLSDIYTEIFITKEETGEINENHEVMQIEMASRKAKEAVETTIRREDLFKTEGEARTVMTKGVAGIGKTVLTQKFTLDWAEGRAHQNFQFVFPLPFKELNLLEHEKFSLAELIHHFFPETKEAGICRFEDLPMVFIFDGLDECRFRLKFNGGKMEITESASLDVLLANLIKGNLLPSAHIWITTRPAAANQIPSDYVMVTEVRGFTDPQKEEYFRRRFADEEQASRIISHIKASRILHIMCHIPVFCWITATVLESVLKQGKNGNKGRGSELPKTLTEMYIHFLVVQTKLKNVKYYKDADPGTTWIPENKKTVESLGKLAFEQLQKEKLMFNSSDVNSCGIDNPEELVYSGVFTRIDKEVSELYYNNMFCFVHLSIQEFLAALHVHLTFNKSGVNLLEEDQSCEQETPEYKNEPKYLYQRAVDKALQSPNGHLDLFLRFLLGLSLETNQRLLEGLLPPKESDSKTIQDTVQYIKKSISRDFSPERSINMFHCLNELKDRSLVNEIQWYLKSGSLRADKLFPAHWAALVFILMSSEKYLEEFELKKYSASEEALQRLLPVVKAARKACLGDCNLSWRSCEALSSVISIQSSGLRELDLTNNDLQDSGVKLLCVGLKSSRCQLETLRLSGCLVTEDGCASLASALESNPSHLKELDLSYNNPGDSGVKLLSAGVEDPKWRLKTLNVDHCGRHRLRPGFRKYACELTLDPNTAHTKLQLSDDLKEARRVKEEQPYGDHPDRFDYYCHLLCQQGLTGRCYWEVTWEGMVHIAMTYKRIQRKGNSIHSKLGSQKQSWSLICSHNGYSVRDDGKETLISRPASRSSTLSHRVAVYVDCPAGILSFYSVSSDKLTHLHTIKTKFVEPLYPAFGFRIFDSSVSLCSL